MLPGRSADRTGALGSINDIRLGIVGRYYSAGPGFVIALPVLRLTGHAPCHDVCLPSDERNCERYWGASVDGSTVCVDMTITTEDMPHRARVGVAMVE